MLQAAGKVRGVTHSFRGIVHWRPSYLPPPTPGLQHPQTVSVRAHHSSAQQFHLLLHLLPSFQLPPTHPQLSATPSSSGWKAILQSPDGPKCPPRAVAVWRKWRGVTGCVSLHYGLHPHLSFSHLQLFVHTRVHRSSPAISASLIGKKPFLTVRTSWCICCMHNSRPGGSWCRQCKCQCFQLHVNNLVNWQNAQCTSSKNI